MTPAEFKQARQSLGLTQAEAARWFGVSPRNVQQWEGGERGVNPTAAILMQAYVSGYRRDAPQIDASASPRTIA